MNLVRRISCLAEFVLLLETNASVRLFDADEGLLLTKRFMLMLVCYGYRG